MPILQNLTSFKFSGDVSGEYRILGGVEAYVSKAGYESFQGVLLLTDPFGHKNFQAQLLADSFAESGFTAVMPDLFQGDAIPYDYPADFDFISWLIRGTNDSGSHLPESVDSIVIAVIAAIRSQLRVTKLAAAGYSFGAKYVVRFLKPGLIDAGFVASPFFFEVDELRATEGPLSIAAWDLDLTFSVEQRRESEDALRDHAGKSPHQISLYSGESLIFSVRKGWSPTEAAVAKKAYIAAFSQAVQWFRAYLK